MHPLILALGIAVFVSGVAPPALAEDCQLAKQAKPAFTFKDRSDAPRAWQSGKVPSTLMTALAARAGKAGKDTSNAAEPFDTADAVCNDWLAICSNDDCTHGVLDCDGICINF